jgi:hypothetical protein
MRLSAFSLRPVSVADTVTQDCKTSGGLNGRPVVRSHEATEGSREARERTAPRRRRRAPPV